MERVKAQQLNLLYSQEVKRLYDNGLSRLGINFLTAYRGIKIYYLLISNKYYCSLKTEYKKLSFFNLKGIIIELLRFRYS